jgi:hypothetical protein
MLNTLLLLVEAVGVTIGLALVELVDIGHQLLVKALVAVP